jgi:oligopeptidase B
MPPKERRLKQPAAKKVRKELEDLGRTRIDYFYWMRDKSDPDVLAYVRDENKFTELMMKRTEALQDKLFKEFVSRTKEDDTTVPVKEGEYRYYDRVVKGRQYPIHCRKRAKKKAKEEIILDENELAAGKEFCKIYQPKISPDGKLLGFLLDESGAEKENLFVKNLATGEVRSEGITSIDEFEWANDNKTVVYSVVNDVQRPEKVFMHVLGADPKDDVLLYHEKDPLYEWMPIWKTKSNKYIMITAESHTTTEILYIDADNLASGFKPICPREKGIRYFADHQGNNFLIITDENAPENKLMEAPVGDTSKTNWRELIPARDNVTIDISDPLPCMEVFSQFVAVWERENGMRKIRVMDTATKESHYISFVEDLHDVAPMKNPDYESNVVRFSYSSLVTPERIYDYDMKQKKLTLRKEDEIPGYDPTKYQAERLMAKSHDGTMVPVLVLHRKDLEKNWKNPCLMYGYGAYSDFEGSSPTFRKNVFSLVDRGFVFALAQVRGGGDLGRRWHKDGAVFKKKNTFFDFIACAEHIIAQGYTAKHLLAINGRSAGGLLMGTVATMRPDLFRVVVAEVPFVDVINSMLDPTIPLTVGEYEEWGGPNDEGIYDYWASYSPYDNVRGIDYPSMLITTGLNDARVSYWEPLKFVAKLRAVKTDENLVLLRAKLVQGHSGASGRYDALKELAFTYAFILDRLGRGEQPSSLPS